MKSLYRKAPNNVKCIFIVSLTLNGVGNKLLDQGNQFISCLCITTFCQGYTPINHNGFDINEQEFFVSVQIISINFLNLPSNLAVFRGTRRNFTFQIQRPSEFEKGYLK